MYDPARNLLGLFNLFIGILDTAIAFILTPLFGLLGLPIPSLVTALSS